MQKIKKMNLQRIETLRKRRMGLQMRRRRKRVGGKSHLMRKSGMLRSLVPRCGMLVFWKWNLIENDMQLLLLG